MSTKFSQRNPPSPSTRILSSVVNIGDEEDARRYSQFANFSSTGEKADLLELRGMLGEATPTQLTTSLPADDAILSI